MKAKTKTAIKAIVVKVRCRVDWCESCNHDRIKDEATVATTLELEESGFNFDCGGF